jgi:hypothetical protein
MLYKAKVAVCSEICTKHSKQSKQRVEFLNVKRGGTYKTSRLKPFNVERLIRRRAVSPLKIKIPSKNTREKPINTPVIHSVY